MQIINDQIIAFDIETVANKAVLSIPGIMPEFKAANNVKDPAKIAAQIADKQKKWRSEAGLSPDFGKIVAVALVNDDCKQAFSGDNEKEILESAWLVLSEYREITGFNSKAFDLPWLIRRSWYCGVVPTKKYDLLPYRTVNHFDLRLLLSHGDKKAKGKLAQFAKLKLGIDMDATGAEVQAMYDDGKINEIAAHCLQDAQVTWRLYKSMSKYYF